MGLIRNPALLSEVEFVAEQRTNFWAGGFAPLKS
jgi:hypothetical protein